jgi:Arc/MetJ-type ribon-helix-helix transcriptional regulator
MKVTTVRLPECLVEDVEEAAEDTGRSQSEYIRHALRIHFEYKPNTNDDRFEQLEARVEALEADDGRGMGVENPKMPKMAANQPRGGRSPTREPWVRTVKPGPHNYIHSSTRSSRRSSPAPGQH